MAPGSSTRAEGSTPARGGQVARPDWASLLASLGPRGDLPRVIATDLDGTLMRDDETISAHTCAVLDRATRADLRVVLVTARPPRWVDHLEGLAGSDGIILCANGAFVYHVRNRQIVQEHTMPRSVALDLIRDLRAALPRIVFGFERADGLAIEAGYTSDYPLPPSTPIGPAEEVLDLPPGKMLARCPGLSNEEFQRVVTEVIGARGIVAYSGAVGLAEISAPGVTKAAALARWSTGHGFGAEDVWAFGDMPNDLPMLTWAQVGFAVANAHPEVLAQADAVCPSNEEDGVAQTVEQLLRWVE